MIRVFFYKVTILALAVVAALVLTILKPSPEGLIPFGVGRAEVRAAPGTAGAHVNSNYNLSQLKVVNVTLQKIHDNYVDPTRIDSRAMLLAALEGVERNVAEVLVEPTQDQHSVAIQVNDKQQAFAITDVDSPWRLHSKLKEIFRFVQANMNPASDAAQVEYAAANGLLSTLDPHSVLLDPEQAKEMDIKTSGKFGGIGIVIGMRNKKLSVIKLISAETPAARAGLKAGDHIMAINNELTANLTIIEAMNRLRGDPETKVTVSIERKGVPTADYPIIRDEIFVSSVDGRLLKQNVGYLRISDFSSSTAMDLGKKMDELRRQGAKGLVLDLRNNPGGLLDQAIKVADLFLDNGTIVTTVGFAGKQREEKRARVPGTDQSSPLAVLVNAGSASASEIVAGALKNLNRALIFGQTTFGKGSVQVLFDNEDGSKLKLTIAQYLTPGDLSIQSVGITPDIELIRARVPEKVETYKDAVRLLGRSRLTREADLDAHLTSKNARAGDKPAETLRYLYVPTKTTETDAPDYVPENAHDPEDGEDPADDEEIPDPTTSDAFVEDMEIQIARDFVASVTTSKRAEMLVRSKGFTQKRQAEEEAKISAALAKLGIDWLTGPKARTPVLAATFVTDKPNGQILAGDTVAITGTVTNSGNTPAYRVHAQLKTDDYVFEDAELAFGRIDPGASRTVTTFIKVPKSSPTRLNEIAFKFTEANGAEVRAQPLRLAIQGQPRPLFAYTYQLIDDTGNSDGLLEAGESPRLHVTVKNLGSGKSYATTAMLRNASGDGVVVNKGRFEFESIPPGETRTVDFTFDVKRDFSRDELMLELTVYDSVLFESVNEKLKFPIRPAAERPSQQLGGPVKVIQKDGATIRTGAIEDAEVIGTAKRGTIFRAVEEIGPWTRIEIEPGRPGFVLSTAVQPSSGRVTATDFAPVWQVTPPTISVNVPSLEVKGNNWHLTGRASDDNHIEDVFIIVSNRDAKIDARKVLYRSNRGSKSQGWLEFSGDIPVWPGNNMITVVARENNEVRSTQTVFINRTDGKKPEGSTAATP